MREGRGGGEGTNFVDFFPHSEEVEKGFSVDVLRRPGRHVKLEKEVAGLDGGIIVDIVPLSRNVKHCLDTAGESLPGVAERVSVPIAVGWGWHSMNFCPNCFTKICNVGRAEEVTKDPLGLVGVVLGHEEVVVGHGE